MNLKAFYKIIICLAVLLIFLSGCIDIPEEENLNDTFNVVLITIHTDPDTAAEEINFLPAVLDDARKLTRMRTISLLWATLMRTAHTLMKIKQVPLAVKSIAG